MYSRSVRICIQTKSGCGLDRNGRFWGLQKPEVRELSPNEVIFPSKCIATNSTSDLVQFLNLGYVARVHNRSQLQTDSWMSRDWIITHVDRLTG